MVKKRVLHQVIFAVSVFRDVYDQIAAHPYTVSFSEVCRVACLDLLEKLPYATQTDIGTFRQLNMGHPCKHQTIAIPPYLYDQVKYLRDAGIAKSISEVIRFALERYLIRLRNFETILGVPMVCPPK